ncbi:MAG: hypothetical protein A2X36_02735 [Elusimicrobia bacterium GWA2_69_24]|nr:MAG: hypothetical protein A2X36_02735 [Elusimicrobia bacterium GWA2_69_24]
MEASMGAAWTRGLGKSGQILVAVMLLLVIMATLVPVLVLFTQRESKWTAKQDQSTSAFHMAEAGIEKGYRAVSRSTTTWFDLVTYGTPIDRFHFDYVFDDIDGGYYTVSVASGPEKNEITIIGVGKDMKSKEVRAIRAVYTRNILGDVAIQAMAGVTVAGGVDVEWGAIVGPEYIDTGDRTYPQFYSATTLSVDSNPDPENCDQPNCCQWFSFNADVPPDPGIDLNLYRSSAQALTAAANGCPPGGKDGTCYFNTAVNWDSLDYTAGGTVFIENNLTVGSPGLDMIGTLIVTGNMTSTSGGWGKGSVDMVMPQTAWKQYCNDWTHYTSVFGTDEGTAPAIFPGLNSDYLSTEGWTYNPTGAKCAVQGFLYVGGNFTTSGGGGNAEIYGSLFVKGAVTIDASSSVTVFYNKEAAEAVRTTKLVLTRKSWQAEVRSWVW